MRGSHRNTIAAVVRYVYSREEHHDGNEPCFCYCFCSGGAKARYIRKAVLVDAGEPMHCDGRGVLAALMSVKRPWWKEQLFSDQISQYL